MTLQFSAQILKVESKVDRTLNVRMNTQELPKESAGLLYKYSGEQVWVAIKDVPLTEKDIEAPDFIPEFEGQKSHSQRLHSVLYRLWESKTDKSKTFDNFYRDTMEKIINLYKEKLT